MQFAVYERNQPIKRAIVAIAPQLEQAGEVTLGRLIAQMHASSLAKVVSSIELSSAARVLRTRPSNTEGARRRKILQSGQQKAPFEIELHVSLYECALDSRGLDSTAAKSRSRPRKGRIRMSKHQFSFSRQISAVLVTVIVVLGSVDARAQCLPVTQIATDLRFPLGITQSN